MSHDLTKYILTFVMSQFCSRHVRKTWYCSFMTNIFKIRDIFTVSLAFISVSLSLSIDQFHKSISSLWLLHTEERERVSPLTIHLVGHIEWMLLYMLPLLVRMPSSLVFRFGVFFFTKSQISFVVSKVFHFFTKSPTARFKACP